LKKEPIDTTAARHQREHTVGIDLHAARFLAAELFTREHRTRPELAHGICRLRRTSADDPPAMTRTPAAGASAPAFASPDPRTERPREKPPSVHGIHGRHVALELKIMGPVDRNLRPISHTVRNLSHSPQTCNAAAVLASTVAGSRGLLRF